MAARIIEIYQRVVAAIIGLYHLAGDVAGLLMSSVSVPFTLRPSQFSVFTKNFFYNVYIAGVATLQAVVLLGLIMGAIILLVALSAFPDTPIEGALGRVYALGFLEIIGPLIVSFVVTACFTPTITYDIASMRISGEYEMLLVTGVNPAVFLISPVFYAVIVTIAAHVIFFISSLLTGTYVVALLNPSFNFKTMMDVFYGSVEAADILIVAFKVFNIAIAVSLFPLREALHAGYYHAEIPGRATRAARNNILYIAISEIMLAVFIYT
jgi:phospholipid/cholesterol/gamma-HCH transport system permease protein